jgi:hypothetical protein
MKKNDHEAERAPSGKGRHSLGACWAKARGLMLSFWVCQTIYKVKYWAAGEAQVGHRMFWLQCGLVEEWNGSAKEI